MSKTEQAKLFDTFYRKHWRQVKGYVRMFARRNDVPRDIWPDLEQAAYLEAHLALRYWRPDGGRNLFNWCAGPIRRGMLRTYRAHCGAAPYGTDALPQWSELPQHQATLPPDLAERIDLKRALYADPDPTQVLRLVRTTLTTATGVDIGREVGLGKSAISTSICRARARLRLALTA